MPTPLKAHILLRVSSPEQFRKGVSASHDDDPGFQEQRCRDLCQYRGFEVAGVYQDAGVTGRRRGLSKRDDMHRSIEAACRDKGVMVFFDLSRLARSASFLLTLADRLEDAGAHLASVLQDFSTTTAHGKFFYGICALIAQLDSDSKSEWQAAANNYIVKKYHHRFSGLQPMECYFDPSLKQRVRDDEAIASIEACRRVRDEVFLEGGPWSAVRDTLNARGIPTPAAVRAARHGRFPMRGGTWTISLCKRFAAPKQRLVKKPKARKLKYPFEEVVC